MVQKNCIDKKILIICGPTASSKTSLAIKCAKLLNTEIISADSMCVYKEVNIGTAKPSIEEMDGIKHHLIDVVSPFDTFSVSDYKSIARPVIDDLLSKNKIPIICGGTGFYINSIIYDLSYGNGEADLLVRNKYKEMAERYGSDYVYELLSKLDYESSLKIHKNDTKRVIRALEIYESGVKKSSIIDNFVPVYDYNAYCIDYPREELYCRINKRVELMFANGLVEEVKNLIKSGVNINSQCMQGIGYKEIIPYLNGEADLESTKELVMINTRHYAKRQITFFKKLNNLIYLKPDCLDKIAERIVENL